MLTDVTSPHKLLCIYLFQIEWCAPFWPFLNTDCFKTASEFIWFQNHGQCQYKMLFCRFHQILSISHGSDLKKNVTVSYY